MKKQYAEINYLGKTGLVEIMAVANGYAMVRRKGCFPFVIPTKAVSLIENTK